MRTLGLFFAAMTCFTSLSFGAVIHEEIAKSDHSDCKLSECLNIKDEIVAKREKKHYFLSKIDHLNDERFDSYSDAYLEGYIQALVDVHYYEFNVIVIVKDRNVTLYNLPKNQLLSKSIITFVKNLPDIESVNVKTDPPPQNDTTKEEQHIVRQQVSGIWFPQSTVLFQPLIADPREPIYSAGLRYDDRVMGKWVIPVSLGDTFPIFRWRNVLPWKGDLQIDIQAGIWSVFKMGRYDNPNNEVSELVTTDYLVGVPLSYAVNRWSYRLRVYHVSSHLGDEFMRNNPQVERLNPSMEAVDFFASYQATDELRVYFGPGWVFHSDNTYPLKPFYLEYGLEARMFGRGNYYHLIYGTPFFAMNIRNWQEHHWQFDGTYQLGYEWSKLQGVGRKVRVFAQYHHGYSEGQFFKEHADYFSIRFSYGF